MITKDYYKILEIVPTATPEAIKRAYRRLAFKYHPDKTQGDPLAELKFKDVAEAYEILSDKNRRINYDYDYNKQHNKVSVAPQPVNGARQKGANGYNPASNTQQPHTPHTLLKTIVEIRRSIESINNRGKRIKQEALYKRLYELLSKYNIGILHAANSQKINRQIIHHTLRCCRFLSYTHVEELSVKLARLAGTDNETIQKIYQFTRHKKRWHFWERHKEKLTIAGIVLFFVSIVVLLVVLS